MSTAKKGSHATQHKFFQNPQRRKAREFDHVYRCQKRVSLRTSTPSHRHKCRGVPALTQFDRRRVGSHKAQRSFPVSHLGECSISEFVCQDEIPPSFRFPLVNSCSCTSRRQIVQTGISLGSNLPSTNQMLRRQFARQDEASCTS